MIEALELALAWLGAGIGIAWIVGGASRSDLPARPSGARPRLLLLHGGRHAGTRRQPAGTPERAVRSVQAGSYRQRAPAIRAMIRRRAIEA